MSTIGIKELRGDIDGVLQRVKADGETIEIAENGHVFARIAPVDPPVGLSPPFDDKDADAEHEAIWAELDRIGQRLSESWPPGLSAVDAIRAERRG